MLWEGEREAKGLHLTVLRGELLAFLPQPHAWLRHAGVLLSLCRASFNSEITVVSSLSRCRSEARYGEVLDLDLST